MVLIMKLSMSTKRLRLGSQPMSDMLMPMVVHPAWLATSRM
jgi:hypothetical protein